LPGRHRVNASKKGEAKASDMVTDTIAAISTPVGEAGIGIVRVSGPDAVTIGDRIIRLRNNKPLTEAASFSLSLGSLIDPETREEVDEILVAVMRAPKTYTREDVVEINCHGGLVPLRRCLELLVKNGARIAEPGEFTKRAFLNGRIDLAQAEAVIAIIQAKTELGARAALRQLRGSLSDQIREIRGKLLELMAYLEADVDFPDEDFERLSEAETRRRIETCRAALEKLLAGADKGRLLHEGVKTVIVGKPNVGKSSILNALLGEKRAIVTEVAGTTRDAISETISVGGILLKIIDTAGIRETTDMIERLGVERA
jgi:tRNA modification GTPase